MGEGEVYRCGSEHWWAPRGVQGAAVRPVRGAAGPSEGHDEGGSAQGQWGQNDWFCSLAYVVVVLL